MIRLGGEVAISRRALCLHKFCCVRRHWKFFEWEG